MSVFVVNDWEFRRGGDVEGGMKAAAQYVDDLLGSGIELIASLWSRSWQNAFRSFHIAAFADLGHMDRAFGAPETARFVDVLYPEVGEGGVRQARCETVLSSGGRIPATSLGDLGPSLVVNDFTFASPEGTAAGMGAAGRYVGAMSKRAEVLLSLWGRGIEEPLRYFHVNALRDNAAAGAARQWPETLDFAAALFPHLDAHSVEQPFTDVVLAPAAALEPESGAAG